MRTGRQARSSWWRRARRHDEHGTLRHVRLQRLDDCFLVTF
jgi:hypothetical protein